ncbi:TonB-dependent receptor [Sphingobacterium corticibacter]|uniref:TonB-dependent receptor n=1 Tax=Sphingobacterium corticibacter TaxID=2171749 RepID=A0A2T8HGX0_9SPHI|nr:TonB-dependent receptor [Sphingobacterium corticibacter]
MCQSSFAQDKGALLGKLTDGDGAPVIGATLSLEPDRHQVQSGAGGKYSFTDLYAGLYHLTIYHAGFSVLTDSVWIEANQTINRDFTLLPAQQVIGEVDVWRDAHASATPDNLLRSERAAMPMQIITRQEIQLMGSRRLDEILKEQTGIAIVNNIGGGSRSVGVQLQGFSSDYVMILIDGQPMVGRNNGNFDLSRISVSNIERIEIVKGASSCLFGSEALGGAINIITRHGAVEPQAMASIHYGSLNMVDATLDGETSFAQQRGVINVGANYYRTDGFNTNPYLEEGQTSPPYQNYSFQTRGRYQVSAKSTAGASIRYGIRQSFMPKNWGDGWMSRDNQQEKDLNVSLTWDQRLRNDWQTMTRYYYTRYSADEFVEWRDVGASRNSLQFVQQVHRLEQQFAKQFANGLQLTGGVGGSTETMRDQALLGTRDLVTGFAYLQGEKTIFGRANLLGGLRYDHTLDYGGRVNPSLGFNYALTDKLSWKAGVGSGFKVPDFRTRYLVFFNPAASYLVVGNELLQETLTQLQDEGQISEIRQYLVSQLDQDLKAEKSTSYHTGFTMKSGTSFSAELNVFYHRIRNQINPVLVATGTNISQIFSYQNLPKVVNKGIEANVKWSPVSGLDLQLGYQYLVSKDLSVIDSIRAGNWPYNQQLHNPKTGDSRPVQPSDYWGIENRSRHMLNIRAFYTYRPWDTSMSVRVNYRGKYPFADFNGNQFIDRYDTFVRGHYLVNAHLEKTFPKQRLSLRFTVDNVLDFKTMLMPGQPGRLFIAGITYRLQRR